MSATPAGSNQPWRKVEWALAVLALAAAASYTATAVAAMLSLSWRQPLFDQFIQLARLLDAPLPRALFVLDNGHALVFSNLVRWLDLALDAGAQRVLIGAGLAALLATAALLLRAVWRETGISVAARAGATLAIALALFWLGNARTLMHGNESTNVHLVMLCATLALLATERAARRGSAAALSGATLAALAAMFTFGAGVPAIGAVLALGALLGVSSTRLAAVALAGAVALGVYVLVLPGGEGTAEALALRPLDTLRATMRYLATPLVNGWLEAGRYAGLSAPAIAQQPFGGIVLATGAGVTARIGVAAASTALGAVGVLLALTLALSLRLQRARAGTLEALGVGFALFALAVAALVAIARLDYFVQHPEQIHADRYSPWASLFWLGLALALLARIGAAPRARAARLAPTVVVLGFAALAWPVHATMPGWAAAVFANAERAGAAYRSGVFDPAMMFPITNAPEPQHFAAVDSFRRHGVATFRAPWMRRVGTPFDTAIARAAAPRAGIAALASVEDQSGAGTGLRFEGWIIPGEWRADEAGLLVVAGDGRIVGSGAFTGTTSRPPWWRIAPARDGFAGYLRVDGCAPVALVAVDWTATRARWLADLAPCATRAEG